MSTETIEQPEVTEETQGEHLDADAIRAEVEAVDVGQFAKDQDERILFRFLRRRAQVDAEITHLKEQTDAMLRQLENQLKGLNYVYLPIAEDIAKKRLAGGKLKSMKTPFGTVGFRTINPSIAVVDEDTLIELSNMREEWQKFIATKQSIIKSALNDHVKATGEIPKGCEMVPGREQFYVK